MKNAMKKIMSLLLVAVLLVSALPFQASAAENGKVHMLVKIQDKDGNKETVFDEDVEIKEGDEAAVKKLLYHKADIQYADYEWGHACFPKSNDDIGPDGMVKKGQDINVLLKEKTEGGSQGSQEQKPAEPAKPAEPTTKWVTLIVNEENAGRIYSKTQDLKTPANGTDGNDLMNYWFAKDMGLSDWTKSYVLTNGDLDAHVETGTTVELTVKAKEITVVVKDGNSDNVINTVSKAPANGKSANVYDMLSYAWNKNWKDNYVVTKVWSNFKQDTLATNGTATAVPGDTISVIVKHGKTNTNTNNNTNNNNNNNNNSGSSSNVSLGTVTGNTLYMDASGTVNKYPYEVKLLVYVKNFGIDWSNPYKTYTVTNSLAKDSLVTMGEVQEFCKSRFTAKDSDGIGYDGLYVRTKNQAGQYALDEGKYDGIGNLNNARKDNEIQIYVVLDNVKGAVSTSTNKSDNPKTGDAIFTTFTALGLSATALAGLYFFGKKKLVK